MSEQGQCKSVAVAAQRVAWPGRRLQERTQSVIDHVPMHTIAALPGTTATRVNLSHAESSQPPPSNGNALCLD